MIQQPAVRDPRGCFEAPPVVGPDIASAAPSVFGTRLHWRRLGSHAHRRRPPIAAATNQRSSHPCEAVEPRPVSGQHGSRKGEFAHPHASTAGLLSLTTRLALANGLVRAGGRVRCWHGPKRCSTGAAILTPLVATYGTSWTLVGMPLGHRMTCISKVSRDPPG